MTIFQHILWGYEITYPDTWIHQPAQDTDVFGAVSDAFDPLYTGPDAGQVLIRGEWNWARRKIEPLWQDHIGKLAGLLGAKNVGSAPWRIGASVGLEAEIVLPQKENRRLWTGILMHDFRVLHFMVTHPKEAREQFEPAATKLISSLRFPNRILGIKASPESLPIPPNYAPVAPQTILNDIADPQNWRAYTGNAGVGALQAFYLRELPIHNWEMEEYIPFPGPSDLGFARLQLRRGSLRIMLGIMPSGTVSDSGSVVYKISKV